MNATQPVLSVALLRAFFARPDVKAGWKKVILARARAKVVREHVDSYVVPLLASLPPIMADRFADTAGERILDPERLYLTADDAACAAFYAECDKAHKAHGYDVPAGHCPALTAETAQRDAERDYLRLADSIIPGISEQYGKVHEDALALFMNPPRG